MAVLTAGGGWQGLLGNPDVLSFSRTGIAATHATRRSFAAATGSASHVSIVVACLKKINPVNSDQVDEPVLLRNPTRPCPRQKVL